MSADETTSPARTSVDDLRTQLDAGEAVLVDVRDAKAWCEGHAPDARHIPLDELADRLGELPAGAHVVTTCGGGTRGVKAAQLLNEAGHDASVLQGGMGAWRTAELPIDVD